MNPIVIRPLKPAEWEAFKDFRLAALKAAPGVFCSTYAEAAARSPEEWQEIIGGSDHQVFGLFDGKILIGITAVFTDREDPSATTAQFAMTFILPKYRGRKLGRMVYDTRLAWVRARPRFKRVTVGHRASNTPSQKLVERYGFARTTTASRTWPDGVTEDEINYEFPL